jgi:hypothetical protein
MAGSEQEDLLASAAAGNTVVASAQALSNVMLTYAQLMNVALRAQAKILDAAAERMLVMLLKESEQHDSLESFVAAIRKAATIERAQ